MKSVLTPLLASGLLALSANASAGEQERVFELRTYTTHENKLPELHERFEKHTRRLFEKHGMMNLAFWVPTDPELKDNTLTYILVHPSREAARANWKAFAEDPEWQRVYKASREQGPLVKHIDSTFMEPTHYSRLR